MEEEEDGEPLVFEVVGDTKLAVEVRKVVVEGADAWGFGESGGGKSEGFVLPYVVGGEGSDGFEDLEMKRLE